MLRAKLAEFPPLKRGGQRFEDGSDLCSTVAPSPALTATDVASPMLSPYWGYEEPANRADDATSRSTAMYGRYLPKGCPPPPFHLPAHFDETKSLKPGYASDFALDGLQDLQASLVSLLSKCHKDGESHEPMSVGGVLSSHTLAPPPGLEMPSGQKNLEMPPGLDERASGFLAPGTTTAMLRNIPNKYTQNGLVERLYMSGFKGEFDFLYLPIDFKNKCNVGYAFVNFRTAEACARFASEYHHCDSREKLPGYNSRKICEVSEARFQGREENIRRLQASSVMAELVANPEWLPKLFNKAGREVEFPVVHAPKEVCSRGSRGRLRPRKEIT